MIINDYQFIEEGQTSSTKSITINDIRNCPKYKNITDEEGVKILESLYQLSIIIFKMYENEFRRF
jgi:hypothetical protein